jgi:hypothetical protein
MAIKNYMINDKWLDIAKQNIVEVESTDGVIGSVKVNGEEYGGGGGSSDFNTATVSINIIGGSRTNKVKFDGIAFLAVNLEEDTYIATDPSFYNPATIPFVLYQGYALATLIPPENFTITNVSTEGDVSVTDNVYVSIRGNGSITITITAD